MRLNLHYFPHRTVFAALVVSGLYLGGAAARADEVAPPGTLAPAASAKTNAEASADLEIAEANKAWRAVYRASQPPMPPAEWSKTPPTQDEVVKFNLDTLHKGMDLARDFYTKYPNHPKVPVAKKIEYEMLAIATGQFGDTNLAPRLAALQVARLSDPGVGEEEKFRMLMDPIEPLMRGLPETADKLEKQIHDLQKAFPKRHEVYQVMLMMMSHTEGARSAAWAKEIIDGPAPDDIKTSAQLALRSNALEKLLAGLPGTAEELDQGLRALPKEFPGNPLAYDVMIYMLPRCDPARAAALAQTISESDAPAATKDKVKVVLRVAKLQELINGLPGTMAEFQKGVHDFEQDYPKGNEAFQLMLQAFERTDGDAAKLLGAELLTSEAPPGLKAQVSARLKQLDYLGKPLEIQYTAVDGREVDVTQMKGKVVLVDFWATWCGPCMGEVPKVKAAYEKLHGQGFEIVGIDLDSSKEALLKTLKAREMTWPQYFETGTGDNKFAKQYEVNSIPTMWLVDKKGVLRELNARGALEDKVAKLLAE